MDPPPVQYVTTSDGYSIACCASGSGEAFVFMPQLFSHIETYWRQETFVLPWLDGLSARFRLIQYDGRGQGMSTRGLHTGLSMQDLMLDLEAVVDALGLERFVLFGAHWFAHTAVLYALKHPDRIRALVLCGCSIANSAWPMAIYSTLPGTDWDAFLRSQSASGQAADVQASLQRLKLSVNREDWLVLASAAGASNLQGVLQGLKAPTLVLHPRDFFNLPAEESMRMAAAIPKAHFVMVDGAVVLGNQQQAIAAIDDFLEDLNSQAARDGMEASRRVGYEGHSLSDREVEVLRLVAAGKSNQQIADELIISLNTVRRHVSNILAKTGASNRADAVSYAHRNGLAH